MQVFQSIIFTMQTSTDHAIFVPSFAPNLTDISFEQLALDTYYVCHIYKFSSSYLLTRTVRTSIIIFEVPVQVNLKSSGILRILHNSISNFDHILYGPVVPPSFNTQTTH
jgi:hypothetical protein